MKLTLSNTKDGSHTLIHEDLDETYHSRHGAIQEAYHVFIRSGLDLIKSKNDIRIFEMGFGTGLNTFITYLENLKNGQQIEYFGLEKHPLKETIWSKLNYVEELNEQNNLSIFQKIHEVNWNSLKPINEGFSLNKIEGDLENLSPDLKVDLIYFDAFGPRVQPNLWTEEIFIKMFELLNPNGILVTYCCKGDVKRAMIKAGFTIEKIPGPPGKREMLRAFKIIN
ncbi:MAG: tRNA (5-methylaminomethyl-2-thiouridine)(34)-methyltransferase MnmD [Salibacteraceae bacterium]